MIQQFQSQWCICRRLLAQTVMVLALSAAVCAQATANLFGVAEPLPADVAFIPEIAGVDTDSITVNFVIAEGYYLYRDKLAFTFDSHAASRSDDQNAVSAASDTAESGPRTGQPVFAEAIHITDEFFGDQAIFRQATVIDVPYAMAPAAGSSTTLAITFQGCADIGLCYPPTTTELAVELPPAMPQPSVLSRIAQSGNSLASALGLATDSSELLPPEKAYLPSITRATSDGIDVEWFIEDGYYLYRDKISFDIEHPDGLQIEQSLLSEGIEQFDEFFGNTDIFRHSANASIRLTASASEGSLAGTRGNLTIRYQGCADIGVCFPPSETTVPFTFTSVMGTADTAAPLFPGGSAAADDGSPQPGSRSSTVPAQSEHDRLSEMLGTSRLWITVATFFGMGLLLAFTPCVLPMIPILSSLIVGQGQSISTGRAFQLSLVYVLVMASTYALVGIAVGLSGYNVQAFLQNPYVLTAIALVFILLSLSMFGFYELQMPTRLQSKLTDLSNRQGGGQVGGVAAMGFISTLIVGPCVTAPLAGALIYIANTGDALIGGTALFALGLGMGAPLLLIGTSAGKFVPKAGAWMDTTKHVFGIVLLAMAVYMVSRFLPTSVTMGLYGILAVMSGVYFGATDSISRQSSGWQRFGKGAGLVVALYGVALLVGALAGGNSYTTPLRPLTAASANGSINGVMQGTHALDFQRVKNVEALQGVVAQASAQGRPVMLDFYADWCISCKEMEAFTFSDDQVQGLLANAIKVQADVTANDAEDQALLRQFNLFGPPGIIFYDVNGRELPAARVVGFMNADDFSAHIRRFLFNTET